MKSITITSLAGAFALALPAVAEQTAECAKACAKTDIKSQAAETRIQTAIAPNSEHAKLLHQVSAKITAAPEQAAEVVKQAILDNKADKDLVLQIAKVATLAAPEQAEAILQVIAALAPEAKKDAEVVIASVLQGDQVAQESSDAVGAARDKNKNAGNEPEGRNPEDNTVWLSNKGALQQGVTDSNSLASKVQNTGRSPNANHNQGANVRGGGTVVIRPNPTTVILPPP